MPHAPRVIGAPLVALVLAAAMPAAAGRAEAPDAAARTAQNIEPGPILVRSWEPMQVMLVRLEGLHSPVYFRSPFAEPGPADDVIDGCIPLAAGTAIADWAVFAVQVLAWPVEMAACPPWGMEPIGD